MVANQISRELFRNFWLGHNPAWFDHMETQSYPRYNIFEATSSPSIQKCKPYEKRATESSNSLQNAKRIQISRWLQET